LWYLHLLKKGFQESQEAAFIKYSQYAHIHTYSSV